MPNSRPESRPQSRGAPFETTAGWLAERAHARAVDTVEIFLADDALAIARARLVAEGFAQGGNLRPHAPFADLIRDARTRGLPASALLVDAAVWAAFLQLSAALAPVGGRNYGLVADAWAFDVPPGQAGWPPHRGTTRLLDRSRPELLNVWIALVDVPADGSCMAFRPLDGDAAYPDALEAPPAPGPAVPLATRAGDVLLWNANTLHWGEDNRAPQPRLSVSFSMADPDFAAAEDLRVIDGVPSADDRLELLAEQILTYGRDQADVTDEVRAWASTLAAFSRFAAKRSGQ